MLPFLSRFKGTRVLKSLLLLEDHDIVTLYTQVRNHDNCLSSRLPRVTSRDASQLTKENGPFMVTGWGL